MFSIARCCRNKLHSTFVTKSLFSRQYMKVSDQMESLLKKSDYVPRGYSLIYREKNYYGFGVGYHGLNALTSLSVALVAYYVYNEDLIRARQPRPIRPGKKIIETYQLCVIIAVSIGFFLLGQMLRKRYPVRIYYSEKDKIYRAIFIGKVPFTSEFYNFPEHCLTYVAKGSMAPWNQQVFNANGRKIMLFDDKFRTYADFQEMFKPGES